MFAGFWLGCVLVVVIEVHLQLDQDLQRLAVVDLERLLA